MTVGAGMLGRDMLWTIAGQALAATTTKGLSIANEPVDVTTDDSAGFRTLMAQSGMSTLDLAVSGVVVNLELMRSCIVNESKIYAMVGTYTDGSTITMDAFFASYSDTGEHNGATTFDASLQSSGAYVFAPGP